MLNSVCIMGRLTSEPELRHTTSNVAVATFRVAVSRDFKDKDGERKADFIPVVCWRNTAEFVSRYFSKGSLAVVDGRLQVREYTDKDGNRRYATEVVADNVYFGESRRKSDTEQTYLMDEDTEQTYPAGGQFEPIEDDDTLPF